MANKIKWEDANFKWNSNPHTWDEVALVIEAVEAISGPPGEGDDFIHPLFDKDPEKKKKLVIKDEPYQPPKILKRIVDKEKLKGIN